MKSAVFLLVLVGLFCISCRQKGARTPAEAHARLRAAASTRNGDMLWDALDQDTHWSFMTIQRAWRECYDITQSSVPEGPERDRLLARFELAATAENARALFMKMLSTDDWDAIAALLAASGSATPGISPVGDTSTITTSAGPIVYHKAHNRFWGWGFSGLAAKAEQIKRTASADLERMRLDAADYERAAARGSK